MSEKPWKFMELWIHPSPRVSPSIYPVPVPGNGKMDYLGSKLHLSAQPNLGEVAN